MSSDAPTGPRAGRAGRPRTCPPAVDESLRPPPPPARTPLRHPRRRGPTPPACRQNGNAERHAVLARFESESLESPVGELPDDPEPHQVEAWVELAELVQDADFRASVRRMAEYQAAERHAGDRTGLHHDLSNYVRERVAAALKAGIDPPAARPHPSSTTSPSVTPQHHITCGCPTTPGMSTAN